MQNGMTIQELLTEVDRQSHVRRDFVASTKDAIRMVHQAEEFHLVLLQADAEQLERFGCTENFHRQVSGKLNIPWKYYLRLLEDHPDMVCEQVNKLFEREPVSRMIRTLDGDARAFLSDRYRRLDNEEVLTNVLPPLVKGEVENILLSSHVGEDKMYLKVLFTDDELRQDIGPTPRGNRTNWTHNAQADSNHQVIAERDLFADIVRPGCIISNSETGRGSLKITGFFFRSYCLNGCVFGTEEAFNFQRTHLGGQLVGGTDFEIFSDDTKRKQDEVIMAELRDALYTMTSPERVNAMGDQLRALASTTPVSNPVAAVDQLAKEMVDIKEGDKAGILEAFIGDADYTQWGMLNAVTAQANNPEISYERASELEEFGGKILKMDLRQWNRIAHAEPVAA